GCRDRDRVRPGEPSLAPDQLDLVPLEVGMDPLGLEALDYILASEESRDGHVRVDVHVDAVHVALAIARQEEPGLAERLRRQGPGVDGGASRLGLALDERDPLAEVRGLGGAPLAGRPATDHHKVESFNHARRVDGRLWSAPGRPLTLAR